MMEHESRCAACSLCTPLCCRVSAQRPVFCTGISKDSGLWAQYFMGAPKCLMLSTTWSSLWKFWNFQAVALTVGMYDLHICISFRMDARYPAFSVGGLSKRQNIVWFNHASKHNKHSNIITISGTSWFVFSCKVVLKITHPTSYWANTTNKNTKTRRSAAKILVRLVILLLKSVAW